MTTTHDCPNCGANLHDDGVSEFIHCRFCGTQITLPRQRRAATRAALEQERDQLYAREAEWDARLRQAGSRGAEDVIVPPVGCCGIYFALFVAGSLILSAIGLKDSQVHGRIVAAVAIVSALIGAVLILWRREDRRRERIATIERDRNAERALREDRLSEIDAQLRELDRP
jgi:hypothetical protein